MGPSQNKSTYHPAGFVRHPTNRGMVWKIPTWGVHMTNPTDNPQGFSGTSPQVLSTPLHPSWSPNGVDCNRTLDLVKLKSIGGVPIKSMWNM